MKVTKPEEKMLPSLSMEEIVEAFDKELRDLPNGRSYYNVFIPRELKKDECDQILALYKGAGWTTVKCISEYRNGGFTSLELWIR